MSPPACLDDMECVQVRGLPVLAGLLGVLLAACSSSEEARIASASCVRLLDHIEEATVVGIPRDLLEGRLGAAEPGAILFRDGLDGVLSKEWQEGKSELATLAGRAASRRRLSRFVDDPVEGKRVLWAPAGCGGLSRRIKVDWPGSLAVTARLRSAAGGSGAQPALGVLALAENPPEIGLEGANVGRLNRRWDAPGSRVSSLPRSDAESWQVVRVVLPSQWGRKSLLLSLLPGARGALVDWIAVRRLTVLEEVCLETGSQVSPERSTGQASWNHRVEIGARRMDALPLPPGARAVFPVEIPAQPARLDLYTGAWATRWTGRLRIRVRAGKKVLGERWLEVPRATPKIQYRSWVLDLSDLPPGPVELGFTCVSEGDGTGSVVSLVGAPTVLRSAPIDAVPNLLLISLDTLRADHLGCYGQAAVISRNIDTLAKRGVLFETVLAPSSYTLPSHATMMTGQHPLVHGVTHLGKRLSTARSPLLAVRLHERGYLTAAFTGGVFLHPTFGFDIGFDEYDVGDPGLAGKQMRIEGVARQTLPPQLGPSDTGRDQVFDWVERHADQPFFLFVHTYVVHNYQPSPSLLESLPSPAGEALDGLSGGELWRRAAEDGDEQAAARLETLYRATVAQADAWLVGPFLDCLDRLDLTRRTIIVLVSDHGEQFLEHGGMGHGDTLYGELMRTPWIMAGPGIPSGVRLEDPVSLMDLSPTLARLLGLPPDPRTNGRDVLAGHAGRTPTLLHLYTGWDGVVDGDWKLVRRPGQDARHVVELFRFDRDPFDRVDLAATDPDRAAGLLELLDKMKAKALRMGARLAAGRGQADVVVESELARKLEEMGYAGK